MSHPQTVSVKIARKFNPTEEQKQAAAEKRTRFRELCRKVSAMTPEAREQIALRVGIITCEGRLLSCHNQCLLASQANGVMPSVVGGFQQWRRLGRMVRKGEHGLCIWIPTNGAKAKDVEDPRPTGDAEANNLDETRFMMGYVFDITQTDEVLP